mmetsp:Transcript_947/g.2374  ORF Transcript_947/g.2374 Transcript_947/m.2374 type:complete len:331 (+) Transcript_947:897-1889(+)
MQRRPAIDLATGVDVRVVVEQRLAHREVPGFGGQHDRRQPGAGVQRRRVRALMSQKHLAHRYVTVGHGLEELVRGRLEILQDSPVESFGDFPHQPGDLPVALELDRAQRLLRPCVRVPEDSLVLGRQRRFQEPLQLRDEEYLTASPQFLFHLAHRRLLQRLDQSCHGWCRQVPRASASGEVRESPCCEVIDGVPRLQCVQVLLALPLTSVAERENRDQALLRLSPKLRGEVATVGLDARDAASAPQVGPRLPHDLFAARHHPREGLLAFRVKPSQGEAHFLEGALAEPDLRPFEEQRHRANRWVIRQVFALDHRAAALQTYRPTFRAEPL